MKLRHQLSMALSQEKDFMKDCFQGVEFRPYLTRHPRPTSTVLSTDDRGIAAVAGSSSRNRLSGHLLPITHDRLQSDVLPLSKALNHPFARRLILN